MERRPVKFHGPGFGSRPGAGRTHLIVSDVRAITAVIKAVQRYTANPPALHVEDVFRIRPQVEGGQYDLSAYLTDVKRGRWFGRLDQYDDSSIIVLGSPATCHPCEHVLASMFGENPYSDLLLRFPLGLYGHVSSIRQSKARSRCALSAIRNTLQLRVSWGCNSAKIFFRSKRDLQSGTLMEFVSRREGEAVNCGWFLPVPLGPPPTQGRSYWMT
jgi:hypothetical protein